MQLDARASMVKEDKRKNVLANAMFPTRLKKLIGNVFSSSSFGLGKRKNDAERQTPEMLSVPLT